MTSQSVVGSRYYVIWSILLAIALVLLHVLYILNACVMCLEKIKNKKKMHGNGSIGCIVCNLKLHKIYLFIWIVIHILDESTESESSSLLMSKLTKLLVYKKFISEFEIST